MILTKNDIDHLLTHKENESFSLSVDCNTATVNVKIVNKIATFDDFLSISLHQKTKDNLYYLLNEKGLFPLAFFSEDSHTFYKLIPTDDWPSIAIGSVPMHSTISPKKDAHNKVRLISPYGLVLDTCMGLGYTAILSSKTAKNVISFEKDENVYLLATHNPLSKALFSSSNIEIRRFDVAESIKQFPDEHFDCILHDPPTFTLAPQLYSNNFYRDVFRVLKTTGKFFHYTPFYKIKRGYDFPSKIKENLIKNGFRILDFAPDKGGIVCRKA